MTWTYDPTDLSTDLAKTRFLCGDTDTNDQLVSDEEIAFALDQQDDNHYLAAADICEALASKYARSVNLSVEGLSAGFATKSEAFAARAARLRAQDKARRTKGRLRIGADFDNRKPAFDVGMHDYGRNENAETRSD